MAARDRQYERRLRRMEREIDERAEHIAAAWRLMLPFSDPLELRFLELERRERDAQIEAELRLMRERLAGES